MLKWEQRRIRRPRVFSTDQGRAGPPVGRSDGRSASAATVQGQRACWAKPCRNAGLLRQMGCGLPSLDGGGSTGIDVGGAMTVWGRWSLRLDFTMGLVLGCTDGFPSQTLPLPMSESRHAEGMTVQPERTLPLLTGPPGRRGRAHRRLDCILIWCEGGLLSAGVLRIRPGDLTGAWRSPGADASHPARPRRTNSL